VAGSKKGAGVLVIGSANVDIVIETDKLPGPGETVLGGECREYWGGKGANQALAALKAGAQVRFVSMTGTDRHGVDYRKHLVSEGIQRKGLFIDPAPTGTALIVVDKKGENQIAVSSGANMRLTPRRLQVSAGVLEYGKVVLAQLEIPIASVATAYRAARRRGAITILNPAPAPRSFPANFFSLIDVIILNEGEAAKLSKQKESQSDSDFLSHCRAIRKMGVGAVVLTAGRNGALVHSDEGIGWIKPQGGILVVDTTGAGDVFSGAFAASLTDGASILDSARFAVAAASLSVRKKGAQGGVPSRRAILRAMKGLSWKPIS
jgi:ribokinase